MVNKSDVSILARRFCFEREDKENITILGAKIIYNYPYDRN